MKTIIDPVETVRLLRTASEQQAVRALSPLQHASVREDLLVCGLRYIAQDCGITLREPLTIDANGEFSIIVDGGNYGSEFSDALNQVPVRCGIKATQGHVLPESRWCRLHHFDAERLILVEAARAKLQEEITKLEHTEHERQLQNYDAS